jgi:hypothetical protein
MPVTSLTLALIAYLMKIFVKAIWQSMIGVMLLNDLSSLTHLSSLGMRKGRSVALR